MKLQSCLSAWNKELWELEWIMGQEIDTNLLTTANHVAMQLTLTITLLDPVRCMTNKSPHFIVILHSVNSHMIA